MVNDLVDAAVVAGKPVVDRRQVANDAPVDAGFLGDLAQRRLLGGLGTLQVSADIGRRERPARVEADRRGGLGTPDRRSTERAGMTPL